MSTSTAARTDFGRAAGAEWSKLRSLRSSGWTLGAMIVASVGLAVLICATDAAHFSSLSPADKATWDPTNESLVGTLFGQLAIGVFGVLAVTSEYASGTIRTSVAAVPSRSRLVLAKVAVYGGVALAVGEVISIAAFVIGQRIFAGHAPHASFTQPGVARAVVLAGVYLALICLISMGLGFLIRHTAGAITAVVAILLVLPGIFSTLPSSLQNSVGELIPAQLGGDSMGAVVPEPHALSPFAGLGVLTAYAVVAIVLAGWSFGRRDV